MITANCACWRLQIFFLTLILFFWIFLIMFNYFAMLFFYFNDGQFQHGFNICFIFFSVFFSLLFRYPSNNFENVITRTKIRVIVSHEIVRRYSIHRLLHSKELMTTKKLLECLKHSINSSCYVLNLLIN
jgi:hypothetical protein